MIHVIAIVTAQNGRRSELVDAFAKIVPAVLAEEGCIEYSVLVDQPAADPAFGADSVVVVEKWVSSGALQAHAASPHMARFGKETSDLRKSTAVHVLDPALIDERRK